MRCLPQRSLDSRVAIVTASMLFSTMPSTRALATASRRWGMTCRQGCCAEGERLGAAQCVEETLAVALESWRLGEQVDAPEAPLRALRMV